MSTPAAEAITDALRRAEATASARACDSAWLRSDRSNETPLTCEAPA